MFSQNTLIKSIPQALESVDLKGLGKKSQGKVRDIFIYKDKRILITTDRQSAFDRNLGLVPFKGQVLTLLSQFWFEKTKNIIANHLLSIPHPNVMIVKDCQSIPVEMVVRGYITGVTTTSIWYSYDLGERTVYGIRLPNGLKKNDKLPGPIITPTTHGGGKGGHDERLTEKDILRNKLVTPEIYKQMVKTALKLFSKGSYICSRAGLILVDTKYEFGLYKGKLTLIDEIHTPDSSRFWIKETYKERLKKGLEPENFDKEFLRLWFVNKGYRGDGIPPKMPADFVAKVAARYIAVYEKVSGKKFIPNFEPIAEINIIKNL